MDKKTRYGRFMRSAITVVDMVLLNMVYFILMFVYERQPYAFFNNQSLLVLNLSYLITVMFFSDIHSQRIVFADKIFMRAVNLVLVYTIVSIAMSAIFIDADIPMEFVWKFYLLFLVVITLWWLVSRKAVKLYREHGYNYRRVIIIGGGAMGVKLLNEMLSDAGYGYRVLGFFDDPKYAKSIKDYRGTIDDVEDYVKTHLVDEMFCTMPSSDDDVVDRLIKIAENNAVDFYYVPMVGPRLIRQFELHTIGSLPALSLRPNPLSKLQNKVVKRVFDIVFASVVMLFSPLVLIPVSIAIKLSSPGPILFKQKRTGYRGKEFTCYKFRTMKVNKDSDLRQASKDDPRKTKVGDFLRKTSIDELPQFYNVLRGDMSIVGPRPHMVKHTQDYSKLIDKYMMRHTIKPGITGWAQVNGYRGQTKELWQMQKRVEYDVWYAENWNLALDLKIIFLTVFNAIRGEKNAF